MILPICAPSGVGKTTFILLLSDSLITLGVSLAVIKSTHHHTLKEASSDTDSHRYLQLKIPFFISSDSQEMLLFAHRQQVDIVLVEGGRSLNLPSVVLRRGPHDPSWQPPKNVLRIVNLENSKALFETTAWLMSQL